MYRPLQTASAIFIWTLRHDHRVTVFKNLVTTAGLNWIANGFGSLWLAVGNDNTPADAGQTILGNELARVAGSLTIGTAKRSYAATITLGSSDIVREAGSFTAASGGTMVSRSVFADKLIPPNDLLINITVDIILAGVSP